MVGPGHYKTEDGQKKKSGCLEWKQNKDKRSGPFDIIPASGNLGPGQYNVEKSQIIPIYKYKESGVFASKVKRVQSAQQPRRKRIDSARKSLKPNTTMIQDDIKNDDDSDEDSEEDDVNY